MSSNIKTNDTLQITKEQGFPSELNFDKHKKKAFTVEDFVGRVFEFKDKPGIRIYHIPPVRNFLVENINGKWLYWGHIHITEVYHDYIKQVTSGKFKIIYIFSTEEMQKAFDLIDRNEDTNFF